MRISTNMLYQLSNTELTGMQASLLKLHQQASANQTVLKPSDDPVASARALDLSQTQALNTQFQLNRNNAHSAMAQVGSTLNSVTNMLTKIRTDVIAAGNAAYSNNERAIMATDLKGNLQELLGYANSRDGLGNYIFAGFRTATQPFTYDTAGNVKYQGDQGQMTLQVDASRQMEVSVSGQAVFQGNGQQDVFKSLQDLISLLAVPVTEAANQADEQAANTFEFPAGSGQFPIQAYKTAQANLDAAGPNDPNYSTLLTQAADAKLVADAANAARTPIAASQAALTRGLDKIGVSFDAQLNTVGAVVASVGARQQELANLDAVGDTMNEQYIATANDLLGRNPSDMSATISALTLQQTYLAVAQKSFVTTSSLTLLNYLR